MEKEITFGSKDVKKFIMNSENNLDELLEYIERDYRNSIEGIFNALFILLKNYEQNKSRVQYLICLLEKLVDIKEDDDLRVMKGPIIDFNNKIFGWSLKDKILIHEPFQQIQELLNKIHRKEITDAHSEKIKYLSFLIFQDRNLDMIENFLGIHGNLLRSKNQDGDDIFSVVLKHYLELDEKNFEEIRYFYRVILLFLEGKYGKDILKDGKQYFRLIKRSKLGYKEHIIKVMELFDPEFSISLEELERRFPIQFNFPNIILKESESFLPNYEGRVDFTNQECVTIDGRNAECLDDALYIEKNHDGTYTLYVHITDIPSLVPYSSLTNEEAMSRGETLYLRDRNILLYPEGICYQLGSLLPVVYRNTITHIFRLDPELHILEDQFQMVKGTIQVKHRLTYEDADAKILRKTDCSLDVMLENLYQFALVRRNSNQEKEKYRKLQNALAFNPNHESLKLDYSPSSNIVHEAMVLVNYFEAKYFKEKQLPFIYRKLELPSSDFIEKQLDILRKLESKYVQSREFQYKMMASYAKPQYTVEPSRHSGVNLPVYAHASSSARRYVDANGQYIIHDLIFDGNTSDKNLNAWEYRNKKLVRHLNDKKNQDEAFMSQYNYLSYRRLIK